MNIMCILCIFKFPKSNYNDYAILNTLYIFTYVYILHICNFKLHVHKNPPTIN